MHDVLVRTLGVQDEEKERQIGGYGLLRRCRAHETMQEWPVPHCLRSERLKNIVSGHCTYANDVMVPTATMRFIGGRSCSEIARALDTGISERHVGRLSNTALEVFTRIHEKSSTYLATGKSRSCEVLYVELEFGALILHFWI